MSARFDQPQTTDIYAALIATAGILTIAARIWWLRKTLGEVS